MKIASQKATIHSTQPRSFSPQATASARRTRPSALFSLDQLDVSWDQSTGTLWTYMDPKGRPNFNPELLAEIATWQAEVEEACLSGDISIRYAVLGSRFPGVFSLGGDLDLFADRIRAGDRAALIRYGRNCVRILYRYMVGLDLPLITIGLIQGDAFGGGFEALLSFNVVVAERGTTFGLPETLFGLFPGMGAHCLLSRRLGSAQAERLILSGKTYTAEEMYDLGLVHALAEPGQGRLVVENYIGQNARRHGGHCATYRASRAVDPVTLSELEMVVEMWADAALQLSSTDLKLMRRLVRAQDRLLGSRQHQARTAAEV